MGITPSFAHATVYFSDDFDSYSSGSINSQGGWRTTTSNQLNVNTTQKYSSPNAVRSSGASSASASTTVAFPTSYTFYISGYARYTSASASFNMNFIVDDGNGVYCGIRRVNDEIRMDSDLSGSELIATTASSTWFYYEYEVDPINARCRGRVDSGSWSNYVGASDNLTTTLQIGVDGSQGTYLDNIVVVDSTGGSSGNSYASSTGIFSYTPSYNSTTTQGVITLSASGNIASADYKENMRLHVVLQRVDFTSSVAGFLSPKFDIPIISSGNFSLSTTTTIYTNGVYTVNYSIQSPYLDFLGIRLYSPLYSWVGYPDTKASTFTKFTVGEVAGFASVAGTVLDVFSPETDAFNLTSCSFSTATLDWSIGSSLLNCIGGLASALFVPDQQQVSLIVDKFRQDFLYKMPWGYATLVSDAFSATTTTALPDYALTVPSSLPMAGHTLDLTPWDAMDSALNRVDTATIETIDGSPLDQFLYWWNILWYLAFAFWLVRELYNFSSDLSGTPRTDAYGKSFKGYSTGQVKRMIKKGEGKGIIH